MKRPRMAVLLLLSLLACGKSTATREAKTQATTCMNTGCPAGSYCGDSGICIDLPEACNEPNTCTCQIINMLGDLPVDDGRVSQVLSAGRQWQPQVVVNHPQRTFFDATVSLELESDLEHSFALQGGHVLATSTPGRAVLAAHYGAHVTCRAPLVNLGPNPQDGRIRFYVLDAASAEPVGAAQVVLRQDGVHQAPLSTSADGLAQTSAPVSGLYDVTVFATDHHYLTLAGLHADAHEDVLLPVSPRLPMRGGFSGRLDYTPYEARLLGGKPQTVRFAWAAGSLDLRRLLTMRPTGTGLQDVATRLQEDCDPSEPGCYTIPIKTGRIDRRFPDGVVMDLLFPVKSVFDVAARAGHRIPWGVGTEISADEADRLIALPVDAWEGVAGKTQELVESLVGLLPTLAVATHAPVGLVPVSSEFWAQQTAIKDLHKRPPTAAVPVLDGGDNRGGPLRLHEPMHQFTDVTLQDFAVVDGLDSVLAITGAAVPGYGFVPLGFGLGLDSTADRTLTGGGVFDHRINGVALCRNTVCPPGVPSQVPDGHLALFSALPFDGLEHRPQLTVIVATSLQNMMAEPDSVLLSGRMIPGPPSAESLRDVGFMPAPVPGPTVQGRRYTWVADASGQLQWARFTLPQQTEWHVYAAAGIEAFTVPPVPAGWDDLGDGSTVAHMTLQIEGTDLDGLAHGQSHGLANFAESVRGFALRTETLTMQP